MNKTPPKGTTEDPRAPNGPLNILCKWRQAYTMLANSGPRGFDRYIRDATDARLLMRAEFNALVALLLQKGVFTELEFTAQNEVEAEELTKALQTTFPGFSATASGLTLTNPAASQTILSWSQPYGLG